MEKERQKNFSRRNFLKITSITGLLFGASPLLAQGSKTLTSENGDHKFDKPMDKAMTYRQHFKLKFKEFVENVKKIKAEFGEEKTMAFIKKRGKENGEGWAKWMLKNNKDNKFTTYTKFLDDPFYDNTLTFEFVERSEKVCEVKVTECIWAEVFKELGAADIGSEYVCQGDFHHCKTFNPKFELIRDKTLMKGDAYCNHRYISKE